MSKSHSCLALTQLLRICGCLGVKKSFCIIHGTSQEQFIAWLMELFKTRFWAHRPCLELITAVYPLGISQLHAGPACPLPHPAPLLILVIPPPRPLSCIPVLLEPTLNSKFKVPAAKLRLMTTLLVCWRKHPWEKVEEIPLGESHHSIPGWFGTEGTLQITSFHE